MKDGNDVVLRIGAGFDASKTRDNAPIIASDSFSLLAGATYRLRTTMRSDNESAKANLLVQSYVGASNGTPAHFWRQFPSEVKLTDQWETKVTLIQVPAADDQRWDDRMGNAFRVRFDWSEREGSLLVRDVELVEMELISEWKSWQSMGFDQYSVVADPMFNDAANDDYRLSSGSPAFALGFKPIPVDEIGSYENPDRAMWPIAVRKALGNTLGRPNGSTHDRYRSRKARGGCFSEKSLFRIDLPTVTCPPRERCRPTGNRDTGGRS